jgi:hypothetical protein
MSVISSKNHYSEECFLPPQAYLVVTCLRLSVFPSCLRVGDIEVICSQTDVLVILR